MSTATSTELTGTVETTNNTPTNICELSLPEDCTAVFTVLVIARRASNGNSKSWFKSFTAKRVGSDDPQLFAAIANLIDPTGDLGALTWDIQFDIQADGVVAVQAKGQSSASVFWYAKVSGLTITD